MRTTPDPTVQLRAALRRPGHGSSDFDLNPETNLPEGRKLRPAGVLVPITVFDDTPRLIPDETILGSETPPGQIAFPGGKQDQGDVDVTATALREAQEEIGLPPDLPEILGHLSSHETVTSFTVTPVVAILREPFQLTPEPGEVDEVFSVPLAHVLNPANYIVESRRWRGHKRYYFTVPFGPYYIWGATARMLRGLAARVNE